MSPDRPAAMRRRRTLEVLVQRLRGNVARIELAFDQRVEPEAASVGREVQRAARRQQRHRVADQAAVITLDRSEEHTSELQSLMRSSYAVFCLKKKQTPTQITQSRTIHSHNCTRERL